ncbi:MAG: hypothetical protein JSU86_06075, partial [Phycisphaerales bacterium]
ADGASVTLTLQDATNVASGVNAQAVVRVFTGNSPDSGTQVILGGGPTGPTVFPLPEDDPAHDVDLAALRAADVSLWVEGLEFAGEVKLEMEVNDGTGSTCSDQIQLKVAPLILLGHLNSARQSFVSQITTWEAAESAEYCTQRFPNATPPGVSDTIIADPDNGGDDPWAQDEFQIGYQESPQKAMYVVLDSKRDRGLEPFPVTLLGPDFGHIQINDGNRPNTRDAFGNLEVSPPCTVDDVSYPLGRIYYGYNPASSLPAPCAGPIDGQLRAFLERQALQAPVALDTDWLSVGHVDEFMSIVPNSVATHGWSVVLASPSLAVDALQGDALTPGGVESTWSIPRYWAYSVGTVEELLSRSLDAPVSGTELDTIVEYNSDDTSPLIATLASITQVLATEFGLEASGDIVEVPVLFNRIAERGVDCDPSAPPPPVDLYFATAITPNLANGAFYGAVYIAPDNFLHVTDSTLAEEDTNGNFQRDPGEPERNANTVFDSHRDPFHAYLEANVPGGLSVIYVDDWLVYHLMDGEVHCSSNEVRTIPLDVHWWNTVP